MTDYRDCARTFRPPVSKYSADCEVEPVDREAVNDWQKPALQGTDGCSFPETECALDKCDFCEELPMPDDAERELGTAYRKVDDLISDEAHWCKQIFLPSDVCRRLAAQNAVDWVSGTDAAAGMQGKDFIQISQWQGMANEATRGARRMVVGCPSQVEAIEAIARLAPNFAGLCSVVAQALMASAITRTPLQIPPILLLGPPGVGKTHIAAAIARAIGTRFVTVSMTTATSVNPLGGTSMTWKNPRIGMVAQALLEGETACPVILLDEIDKAFRLSGDADPLGPLHALMEPETARNFPDEFLEMPVAADDVIWISTANSVDNVAPSILDRHLILEIAAPDRDQMSAVIGSIYRTARSGYGAWFDPQLSAVVTARLVSIHPRRVKRLLCLACTRAASMGRQELAVADIEAVLAITSPAKAQGRIGFLS